MLKRKLACGYKNKVLINKEITLLVCLIFFTAKAFSQSKPVVINSIPAEGILLTSGWKFHAGDNAEWAKPGFNDSGWAGIDPSADIYYLPQVRNAEIGWFRLKLIVDSSFFNKTIGLTLSQTGASEIYFNGNLIYRLGKVSKIYNQEKTLNLWNRPMNVKLGSGRTQEIAVRFSYTKRNFIINYVAPNPCFSLVLIKVNDLFDTLYSLYYRYYSTQELILIAASGL